MTDKEIAVQGEKQAIVPFTFNEQQVELIKKTVAKGCTNDELALFMYTCKRTGLDPLIRQIYAVKRGGASNQMTIQTGIDGYRLIAERTGRYVPGRESTFIEKDGKIISATAYVKKLVNNEWHEVAATAYFDEYAPIFNGQLGAMWKKMGHVMISKCAEALVLRRAFPAEISGLYTSEEMAQAETVEVTVVHTEYKPEEQRHTAPGALAPKNDEKAPPAQSLPPSTGPLTAKGMVVDMSEANKGGYVSVSLEGNFRADGKLRKFSTNVQKQIDYILDRCDAGESVTLEYTENPNPKFADSITKVIEEAFKGDAPGN